MKSKRDLKVGEIVGVVGGESESGGSSGGIGGGRLGEGVVCSRKLSFIKSMDSSPNITSLTGGDSCTMVSLVLRSKSK